MMTSREQFEATFRKAYPDIPQLHKDTMLEWYNHGTDDEPEWGYYSLLARQAFEWWELSREALEVELPKRREYVDTLSDHELGFNIALENCAEAIRSAGIKVKGE